MSQDINVLALVKGAERYVFLYDDASRAEALRVLGRYASNPELSFSWYDAAVLSQKIRQESQKATGTSAISVAATERYRRDVLIGGRPRDRSPNSASDLGLPHRLVCAASGSTRYIDPRNRPAGPSACRGPCKPPSPVSSIICAWSETLRR